MTYRDMTFCASKNCQNKCYRRLTEEDRKYLLVHDYERVSMSYFCDDSGDLLDDEN